MRTPAKPYHRGTRRPNSLYRELQLCGQRSGTFVAWCRGCDTAYSGFWKLGRPVNLSPLEVANAFNAPVLGELQGNRPAGQMLDEAGEMKVRYSDSGVVGRTSGYGGEEEVKKIEIGPVAIVKAPEKGARYI